MKNKVALLLTIALLILIIPTTLFLPACNTSNMPETTIVWALPDLTFTEQNFMWPGYPLIEEWEQAVVRAIRERGGDFRVHFVTIGSSDNYTYFTREMNLHPWYTDVLIDVIDEGHQIDIITVFSRNTDSMATAASDAYFQMYQAGLTLALCDFLQSEDGRVIYETFPPVVWDAMRIGGEIHGFPVGNPMNIGAGFIICRELAEQIDTSLLTNNLVDVAKVFENHDITFDSRWVHPHFFDMINILPGIAISNGEILQFYEEYLVARYFEGISLMEGHDMFRQPWVPPSIQFNHIEYEYKLWQSEENMLVFVSDFETVATETSAVVINPDSEFVEEILQLMVWLRTDREFANLFTYGVEGVHMKYDNGLAFDYLRYCEDDEFENGYFLTFYNLFFGTTLIAAAPNAWGADQRVVIEQRRRHYDVLEPAPHTGFRFDRRGWEELIVQLYKIEFSYSRRLHDWEETADGLSWRAGYTNTDLIAGTDPNWRETLASLNADLRAAGIMELVEEVQRQFDEWYVLHSPVNR
ncbi:MAG: hypothetical protein FWB93_00020 [Oscillospiraceae bacterium]|nr:hypothetical protein [Oscillospiraceae bacterium]